MNRNYNEQSYVPGNRNHPYFVPQQQTHSSTPQIPNQQQNQSPVLSRRAKRRIFKGVTNKDGSGEFNSLLKKVDAMDRKMTAILAPTVEQLPKKTTLMTELKSLHDKFDSFESKQPNIEEKSSPQINTQPNPVAMTAFMQKVLTDIKTLDDKIDNKQTPVNDENNPFTANEEPNPIEMTKFMQEVLIKIKTLDQKLDNKKTPLNVEQNCESGGLKKQPNPNEMAEFMQEVLVKIKAVDEKLDTMTPEVVPAAVVVPFVAPTEPAIAVPLVAPTEPAVVAALVDPVVPTVEAPLPWYRRWFW